MNIEFNKKISWIEKNTNYTAKNKDRILIATSAITITLPTSPSLGDNVWIANGRTYNGGDLTSFSIASVKIFGTTKIHTFTFTNQQFAEFVYQDSTQGWIYHEKNLTES